VNAFTRPIPKSIHRADCSLWDTPADSQPEALLVLGYRDDVMIAYLSAARPIYDALKRCLGQLSGLLLLYQAKGLDRNRSDLLITTVRQQLGEAGERLRALVAPAAAGSHYGRLVNLGQNLKAVSEKFDRTIDLVDPASADLDAVVDALFSIQRGLLATAEPRAGLAPVDFTAACCTCRPRSEAKTV
jgi:hypothetical protein